MTSKIFLNCKKIQAGALCFFYRRRGYDNFAYFNVSRERIKMILWFGSLTWRGGGGHYHTLRANATDLDFVLELAQTFRFVNFLVKFGYGYFKFLVLRKLT